MQWDEDKAVAAYKEFYEKHGITPSKVRNQYKNDKSSYPEDVGKLAINIDHAVLKYAGGVEAVRKRLGIELDRTRVWSKEHILSSYQQIIDEYGMTPNSLRQAITTKRVVVDEDTRKLVGRLIDATSRVVGE